MTPVTSYDPNEAPETLGTDEWAARRRDRWNDEARDLVRVLRTYEDCHPDDSICLSKALTQAEDAAGMVRHAH